MSSILNSALVNHFVDLHVSGSDGGTKEIPKHHPFKYCLRFKAAQAKLHSKISTDSLSLKENNTGLEKNLTHEASTEIALQTEEDKNIFATVLSGDLDQESQNSKNPQGIQNIKNDRNFQANNNDISLKSNKVTVNTLNKSLNHNRESLRNNHLCPKYNSSSSLKLLPKLNTSLPMHLKKSTISTSSSSLKQHTNCKPPVWKSSTFKSFVTSGVGKRNQQAPQFAYDLSRDELKCMASLKGAMKPPTAQELKLLKAGQRLEYLTQRYSQAPECKYNYPEATSWRIGWMHNQRNQ